VTLSDESFTPAIIEAIRQRDEGHLRDILSRIPAQDRVTQVNQPDRHDITPLMWAVNPVMARASIVAMLLEAGADPSRVNQTNINTRNPQILYMLEAAQDRTTLRQVVGLPTNLNADQPRARRRM